MKGISSFTLPQAIEVKKQLAEKKLRPKEIAAQYNVNVCNIYAIKEGRTWRNLSAPCQ